MIDFDKEINRLACSFIGIMKPFALVFGLLALIGLLVCGLYAIIGAQIKIILFMSLGVLMFGLVHFSSGAECPGRYYGENKKCLLITIRKMFMLWFGILISVGTGLVTGNFLFGVIGTWGIILATGIGVLLAMGIASYCHSWLVEHDEWDL